MLRKKDGFEGQRSIVLPKQIITQLCINNPVINGSYITDIGYYPKAKYHFRKRNHGIDQHILIYCLEGKGNVQIDKRKYDLGPGSFIIIPAGSPHNYSANADDSWTIYWAHFKGHIVNALVALLTQQLNGHHGYVSFQQKRIDLFENIYTCFERGYGYDNLCYANLCFHHFLSSFIYHDKFTQSEKTHSNNAVELSINFLQQNLSRVLSLGQIARSVNISSSHYSNLFKKKTGFSPIEYFNHLKVQKACQYLMFTDLRIKEIALELGIEDPYYFSRMFRKVMGQSPEEYRQRKG